MKALSSLKPLSQVRSFSSKSTESVIDKSDKKPSTKKKA